jgi:hypothetical protein
MPGTAAGSPEDVAVAVLRAVHKFAIGGDGVDRLDRQAGRAELA